MMNYAQNFLWCIQLLAALAAAPLIPGIINKTKAFFAGRKGPSVFQLYYDLAKLLEKSSVYCSSTTGIFRIAPYASLAATTGCLMLMPFAACVSPFAFPGDMILFLYLFGAGRMMTVLGALETASSFEGMGASRECQFSALAEVPAISVFMVLAMLSGKFSLSGYLSFMEFPVRTADGTAVILLAVSFYIVTLCESCRVPVDDPETHLELTMIHEAMILDNSGPDLAAILYGSALKLWAYLSFLVLLILPERIPGGVPAEIAVYFVLMFFGSVSIGVVESMMARYRFLKVPQLLVGAFCIAMTAAVLLIVFPGGAL